MTDMADWIKERRTIHNAATEGPWEDSGGGEIDQHWSCPTPYKPVVSTDVSCMSFCYGGSSSGVENDEDMAAIVDAHNTLPTTLTALEKVLELHKPERLYSRLLDHSWVVCPTCSEHYPCPTVQAIEGAINE